MKKQPILKPPKEVMEEVTNTEVTKRKYRYVGHADIIKIGDLVVHGDTITDDEIDLFLKNYPRLNSYFVAG